ncbi:hypothetical protein M1141_00400 [Candidatus Marsarchaeota archaeon]|nr:hypothetical protein [Candidatus Marsarchaeota archaeon]
MAINMKGKGKKAQGFAIRKSSRNYRRGRVSQPLAKNKIIAKHRKKSAAEQSALAVSKSYASGRESLFEELLITKILGAGGWEKNNIMDPDESPFLLKNIAVNFTETLTKINYKNGFFTGKALYSVLNREHNYISYHDSMPHLAEFFELCGFRHVLFNDFSGKAVIRIPAYGAKRLSLGFNTHSFEAGLISGFISSARHKLIFADEIRCRDNNADFCEFECRDFSIQSDYIKDIGAAVGVFSNDFAKTAAERAGASNMKARNHVQGNAADTDHPLIYYYLSCHNIFFNSSFNKSMKEVLWYIASAIRRDLDTQQEADKVKTKLPYAIEQAMELLMVRTEFKSAKPLHVKLKFNTFNSKTEFINLAVSFFNRLASSKGNLNHTAVIKSRNGVYTVDICSRHRKKTRHK